MVGRGRKRGRGCPRATVRVSEVGLFMSWGLRGGGETGKGFVAYTVCGWVGVARVGQSYGGGVYGGAEGLGSRVSY